MYLLKDKELLDNGIMDTMVYIVIKIRFGAKISFREKNTVFKFNNWDFAN